METGGDSSALTEWSETIAVSDQRNKEAFLADLEARYVAMERERDQLFDKAQSESERANFLEKRASELQNVLTHAEASKAELSRDCQMEKEKSLIAEAQQRMQQERLTRLEEEGDKLREEISRLTKGNKDLNDKLVESETKAKLNDSAAIPLQYEVERLQKEIDSLTSHTNWLELELACRNDTMVSLKLDHSTELLKLRDALDQSVADRDDNESRILQLERSNQEYANRAEKLASDLRIHRLEAAAADESAEKELIAERRLIEMLKEQLDRSESRYKRLEKELDALRSLAMQASDDTQKQVDEINATIISDSEKVVKDLQMAHQKEISALKKKLDDANRARDEAEDGLLGSPHKRSSRQLTEAENDEPMSLTDLYAKLNATEDELNAERIKRKKAELIYQRVHADIAAKTPLLQRQRQEHERAMEQLDEVQGRLQEALQELYAVRKDSEESRVATSRLETERNTLKLQTRELAKQVQALLTSKTGGTVPSGIPVSVEEIQAQNLKLIGEHARMTFSIEDLQEKLRNDRTTLLLEEAEKEVELLREHRQRQEILVSGIVQQRDLYRALLAKHGDSIGEVAVSQLVVAQHTEQTKTVEERNMRLEQDLAKVQTEVMLIKNDRDSLEERIARYDAHTSELTSSIGKLQNELSSALSAAARSQAEGGYFRDKCVRVEESLDSVRDEIQKTKEGKMELQKLNARLQQSLAAAGAEVVKYESQAREAERKQRLAEAQSQTAKSSELRLNVELSQVRSELSRQGSLVESVRKIEAGMAARNDEEKEKLKDSHDRISQLLEAERSKYTVEMENMQNSIRDLEVEIKSIESKKDGALTELVAAKEEALASTTALNILTSKCDKLQSQLASAKRKLGDVDVDDAEVTLGARLEVVIGELEQTKLDLTAANTRVSEFQKISKASEDALGDLTKATEAFKSSCAAKIEELTRKIDVLKKENQAKQDLIIELTNDLTKRRSDQEIEMEKLQNKITALTDEVVNAKKDSESATLRADSLAIEMEKYRSELSQAQNDYERELNLHAIARTELRKANETVMMEQNRRRVADESFEKLQATIAEKEITAEEEKKMIESSMKEAENLLQETRGQNNVLHKQLASLAEQVEMSQAARIEAAAGEDGTTVGLDEAGELQKTISELREVVRYMRGEHELIQAQVDAARRTAERERAATGAVKRSLEEARAEIKILQDKEFVAGHTSRDADQTEKLKNADMQLILLRESNQLLRAEMTKLETSLNKTQSELDDMRSKLKPFEENQGELEIQKAALSAENSSLKRELETWKGRLHSMVSKFNTIDPDEHNKVVSQVEGLKEETASLKARVVHAEKETAGAKSALAKLNKDLSQQKAMAEKQAALLVKTRAEKDAAAKKSSASIEMIKERDQLKEKIQKMESDAKSDKTEMEGAHQRNEMLKKRMRQFQDILNKQTAKIDELEKALASVPPVTVTETATKPIITTTPAIIAVKSPLPEKTAANKETEKGKAQVIPKEMKAITPNQEAKDDRPTVPEGGFKFAPGGKRTPLDKNTEETSSLLQTTAPISVAPKAGTTQDFLQTNVPVPVAAKAATTPDLVQAKAPLPVATKAGVTPDLLQTKAPLPVAMKAATTQDLLQTKASLPTTTKLATPPDSLQSKTSPPVSTKATTPQGKIEGDGVPKQELPNMSIKPSPVRPNSPMREKADLQTGGDDSEAMKKKALIAKLNEKKRKLAEAKAQKQAQLSKSPIDTTIGDEKADDQEKKTDVNTVIESKADRLGAVPISTQVKDEGKQAEPVANSEMSTFGFIPGEPQEPSAKKAKTEETNKVAPNIDEPVAKTTKPMDVTISTADTIEKVPQVNPSTTIGEVAVEEAKIVPPMVFGKVFGSVTPFGTSSATFGNSSFGAPTAASHTFDSSTSIQSTSGFSGIGVPESSLPSTGAFLTNMKPPNSNAAPFTFGSTSGPIILPTPSNPQPLTASPFGAFTGSPFGGGAVQAKPLFVSSISIKRSAPDGEINDEMIAKQPRGEATIDEGDEGQEDGAEDGIEGNE